MPPHRTRRVCMLCARPSMPSVCTTCKDKLQYRTTKSPLHPIVVRDYWPDIGAGMTLARSFRESA